MDDFNSNTGLERAGEYQHLHMLRKRCLRLHEVSCRAKALLYQTLFPTWVQQPKREYLPLNPVRYRAQNFFYVLPDRPPRTRNQQIVIRTVLKILSAEQFVTSFSPRSGLPDHDLYEVPWPVVDFVKGPAESGKALLVQPLIRFNLSMTTMK